VGLPATAGEFREALQGKLAAQCAATDAGYPDNADLVIDDEGRPSLKTHRASHPTETSLALEAALRERMPERTLLSILARTAHWLDRYHRFSPASGSDPKLADPSKRARSPRPPCCGGSRPTPGATLSTRPSARSAAPSGPCSCCGSSPTPSSEGAPPAETNKVESYSNFSSWCRFGNGGVIATNDPAEQEKILKFSTLMTNAVIFHTTVDMTTVIRELIAESWQITPADLAAPSPYVTARIQRFGVYATDEIALTPEPFNAHLGIDLATAS
jgi:Tn3 transposase DDE domain